MKRILRVFSFFLISIPVFTGIQAEVISVPEEYGTIQAGISAASEGDTVLVSAGTYSGDGSLNLDFQGKGILVTSAEGADNTVIDCREAARGVIFSSGEGEDSIFEGFTIRNGYVGIDEVGGGILIYLAYPTIRNNIIEDCYGYLGGGIGCIGGGGIIEENEIRNNLAERGGGIGCFSGSTVLISKNIIVDNFAEGG